VGGEKEEGPTRLSSSYGESTNWGGEPFTRRSRKKEKKEKGAGRPSMSVKGRCVKHPRRVWWEKGVNP